MFRKIAILLLIACSAAVPNRGAAEEIPTAAQDTVWEVATARQAFLNLSPDVLHLLSRQMREDMLAYLDNDTIRPIYNALGGQSSLTRPVTDTYLKCQISPVSSMTIRILPAEKSPLIATVYTIDSPGQPADSQISFYDSQMKPVKTSKHLSLARIQDFIVNADHEKKKQIMDAIPFPTVEYVLGPDGNTLTATLTAQDLLGEEQLQEIRKYLNPTLTYSWNGRKFIRSDKRKK